MKENTNMSWWMIAAFCAFFVKGLCGFANTLVFTSILSFTNSNRNISPVELLLGYPTNAILAFKERKNIQWRLCLPLAALVVLGNIPGILFLKNANTTFVKQALWLFPMMLLGLALGIFSGRFLNEKKIKVLVIVLLIFSGLLLI